MIEAIRPAATVVLWRTGTTGPEVLMGQRGVSAVFMPSKYVFPGGGVDLGDHAFDGKEHLSVDCARRLTAACDADAPAPAALVSAALRELSEETGLQVERPTLQFIFRAITPPGRSRRFDARFFLLDARAVSGPNDDFSRASDELAHLHWIGLSAARSLDLPFITEIVLAEVGALLAGKTQPGVPFFDNSSDVPTFRRIV